MSGLEKLDKLKKDKFRQKGLLLPIQVQSQVLKAQIKLKRKMIVSNHKMIYNLIEELKIWSLQRQAIEVPVMTMVIIQKCQEIQETSLKTFNRSNIPRGILIRGSKIEKEYQIDIKFQANSKRVEVQNIVF